MENHFVEVVEIETGKIETCLGPMSAGKAERCEGGMLINMDTERFFVRTGTRAALDAEAAARAATSAAPVTALTVAQGLGLEAAPGFEAELEDGQGLMLLIATGGIGPARAARLHEELGPRARAERERNRVAEDKAAELLAAGLECAAHPRSKLALARLQLAALVYGAARGVRPATRKVSKPKKGSRR